MNMMPAKAVLEEIKGLTSTYLIPVFDVFCWLMLPREDAERLNSSLGTYPTTPGRDTSKTSVSCQLSILWNILLFLFRLKHHQLNLQLPQSSQHRHYHQHLWGKEVPLFVPVSVWQSICYQCDHWHFLCKGNRFLSDDFIRTRFDTLRTSQWRSSIDTKKFHAFRRHQFGPELVNT